MPTASNQLPDQIRSLRRSATLPPTLDPLRQRNHDSLGSSDDILFYHPSAKIVHFSPRAVVPIPSSSAPTDFDYPVDTIETLPWRSATERTVALAPLRLERGLTVFLKCGSVVQAILKNSQCWCVDGESTFVLRIGPLKYYRIELPLGTEGDRHYVDRLKSALPGVLRYEVTPCPFKRGFTVELPQEAVVPKKKRAWRPRERRESAPVYPTFAPELKHDRNEYAKNRPSTAGGTRKGSADTGSFSAGRPILETIPDDIESSAPLGDVPKDAVVFLQPQTAPQEDFNTLRPKFEADKQPGVNLDLALSSSSDSFQSIQHSSSPALSPYTTSEDSDSSEDAERITEAPHRNSENPVEPTPSQGQTLLAKEEPMEHPEDDGEPSMCQDSLENTTAEQNSRSYLSLGCCIDESPESQRPPSEDLLEIPVFQGNPPLARSEDQSICSEQDPPETREDVHRSLPTSAAAEQEPVLLTVSDTQVSRFPRRFSAALSSSNMNDMTASIRYRAKESRMREMSPMPPPSTLHQPRPHWSAKRATASFFHKTCTLVLVPPVQLLLVLIHVAAQIVIKPGQNSNDLENEDDYGVPITPGRAASDKAKRHAE